VSAIVVGATGWLWLDALTAIGVGLAVIVSALGLLREAIALNLDAAPRHINLAAVEAALLELPDVQTVAELHVWGISTSRTALTAHLMLRPGAQAGEALLEAARQRLETLGIRKSTIQLEWASAD
jgi:cobalt-zinc-cadmium efflux system protein